jgi:hypothetical protein
MVRAKFAGATELPQSSGAGTLAAAVGGEAEWYRGGQGGGGCFISFKKRERHIFVPVDLPTISPPTMILNKSPAL